MKFDIAHHIQESFRDLKPRAFDKYVLGGFMVWYALRSNKMGKWPRRLLLTAGIYQLFYNWPEYQKLAQALSRGKEGVTEIILEESEQV